MKTFLFCFFAMLSCTFAYAQTATIQESESLLFKETAFDFGKIPQSKPVFHTFMVENKSGKALKIENVQASCGCTTPEWSREEIAAGASSAIKVGYNAAAEGPFEKTITVSYGGQAKVLRIKGEVWKTPATPAPANASIELLQQKAGSRSN